MLECEGDTDLIQYEEAEEMVRQVGEARSLLRLVAGASKLSARAPPLLLS